MTAPPVSDLRVLAVQLPFHTWRARQMLHGIEDRCHAASVVVQTLHGNAPLSAQRRLGRWIGLAVSLREGDPAAPDLTQLEELLALGLPVVNCASKPLSVELVPSVLADASALGALAGRWLRDHGWHRIALINRPAPYAEERARALAAELGTSVEVYQWLGRKRDSQDLVDWLAATRMHDALVVESPGMCRDLLSRHPGVAVDRPLLVLEDEPATCTGCAPALTAVDLAWDRVGYLAADMILGAGGGWPPDRGVVLVPPRGVIERDSSRSDGGRALVHQLCGLVRESFPRRMAVDELCRHLGASRSTLERSLGPMMGMGPGALCSAFTAALAQQRIDAGHPSGALAIAMGFREPRDLKRWLHRWRHRLPSLLAPMVADSADGEER